MRPQRPIRAFLDGARAGATSALGIHVYVVSLQAGLLRAGYYPGDDEMEDWVFGGGTQSALLTFQAPSLSRLLEPHVRSIALRQVASM